MDEPEKRVGGATRADESLSTEPLDSLSKIKIRSSDATTTTTHEIHTHSDGQQL